MVGRGCGALLLPLGGEGLRRLGLIVLTEHLHLPLLRLLPLLAVPDPSRSLLTIVYESYPACFYLDSFARLTC
ncbi:hypothetical protein BD310DRAFT_854553, partial [Dichomitus squalens]